MPTNQSSKSSLSQLTSNNTSTLNLTGGGGSGGSGTATACISGIAAYNPGYSTSGYTTIGSSSSLYPYNTTYTTPSVTIQPQPWTGFTYSQDLGLFPYGSRALSQEEVDLIKDFKTRHPDFDDYSQEINLITSRRSGLLNTPLFISLIYNMAKDLRRVIEDYTKEDKIEEIIDGTTQETNR